ncbi:MULTISPECIES: hypothetical protein [Methylococcus]|uniref:Uncharacterized protein n=1 Tax=Methylococcus capsulatus TaxID=414 RepID=A0ABZ2F8A6_METCP|nr:MULTISPECIES: hypothetical protein [Methylococcus]MDF9393009.1 hypothetical protein [Methylococcus capsulatus]
MLTPDRLRRLQGEFPEWQVRMLPGGAIAARPPRYADWGAFGRRLDELAALPVWAPPVFHVIQRPPEPKKCKDCRWFALKPGRRWMGRCQLHDFDVTAGRRRCWRAEHPPTQGQEAGHAERQAAKRPT